MAKALAVDGAALGLDLLDPRSPVRLEPGSHEGQVVVGPRVGLSAGHETPWRFWLEGEPTVSPYRPGRVTP